jgi:hypothetical protein
MLADIGISRSDIRSVVEGVSGFTPRTFGPSKPAFSLNDDALGRIA